MILNHTLLFTIDLSGIVYGLVSVAFLFAAGAVFIIAGLIALSHRQEREGRLYHRALSTVYASLPLIGLGGLGFFVLGVIDPRRSTRQSLDALAVPLFFIGIAYFVVALVMRNKRYKGESKPRPIKTRPVEDVIDEL